MHEQKTGPDTKALIDSASRALPQKVKDALDTYTSLTRFLPASTEKAKPATRYFCGVGNA